MTYTFASLGTSCVSRRIRETFDVFAIFSHIYIRVRMYTCVLYQHIRVFPDVWVGIRYQVITFITHAFFLNNTYVRMYMYMFGFLTHTSVFTRIHQFHDYVYVWKSTCTSCFHAQTTFYQHMRCFELAHTSHFRCMRWYCVALSFFFAHTSVAWLRVCLIADVYHLFSDAHIVLSAHSWKIHCVGE